MLETAYFGSHGVKLVGQIIDNIALIPGPGPISARQLNPAFPPYVLNKFNMFPSWYDGLNVKLQKRMSHGLMFLGSYTFSNTLDSSDNLGNASLGRNPTSHNTRFTLKSNKCLSRFPIPQNTALN